MVYLRQDIHYKEKRERELESKRERENYRATWLNRLESGLGVLLCGGEEGGADETGVGAFSFLVVGFIS